MNQGIQALFARRGAIIQWWFGASVLVATSTSCRIEGPSDAAGSGGHRPAQETGSLVLTSQSVERSPTSGGQSAPAGQTFLVVDLALDNHTTDALPLSSALFSIETPDGLVYRGSPTGEITAHGCTSNMTLASGGHTSCSVAFLVPLTIETTQITYTSTTGSHYQGPITVEPCEPCGNVCLPSDCRCTAGQVACGTCGLSANELGVGSPCTPGGHECAALAASLCTADLGAEASLWFCTRLCPSESCGTGAHCQQGGCVRDDCAPP